MDGGVVRGRAYYRRRAWLDAFASLSAADLAGPLAPADLELLGMSAGMVRRDEDAVRVLERAHGGYVESGEVCSAARCAFWVAMNLLNLGEPAMANGWFGRAGRLLDGQDCVERAYLLVPDMHARLGSVAEARSAESLAAEVMRAGERFGDVDLIALARHAQGRVRIKQGRFEEGMALLDETMVAVVAGELSSPVFPGLIYCSVLDACHEVFDLRRAREWTGALSRWCDAQPQLIDFTGVCLVHRAECLQLHGAWPDAIDEARRACARLAPGEPAWGAGLYRQAEIHRLCGEFAAAEDAYRRANERGWQPQPGLALLWLVTGRVDAALAAIIRVLGEITDRLCRAQLLPAGVVIMLAAGDTGRARTGYEELAEIASTYPSDALSAMAAFALGAVELADGRATDALIALHTACQLWQNLDVPYEVARTRTLLGLACRELGDHDTARWEFRAARDGFARLGARPDLDRLGTLLDAPDERPAGLTPRELQVLRLVAAGKSNRGIAAELVLSERTVDRHVSSILTKLGVPSRTAATAYAYSHHLV
jgi:DNA-binding CsgD family transcriptional regulator